MKNGAKPDFSKIESPIICSRPETRVRTGNGNMLTASKLYRKSANFLSGFKKWRREWRLSIRLADRKQRSESSDMFTYDPLDTTRGEMVDGTDPKEKTAGIDQTYALSIGNDGLVYHTDPLPNETPLVGCPALTLWVSIDTPDVDLSADLYEIQPDGTSVALWSDIRRLRYRESLREAKLVKPGEIVKCDFNPGLFVARRLMKGSRLRLVVTAVNSILWQKNYCSGGVVAEETAKDARTCHVHVYHDAPHASAIQLPLR